MRSIQLIFAIVCLISSALAEGPFETKVTWNPIEASFAKSASIESMPDKVAVFMVDPESATKRGIELQIESQASAMIVEARLVFGRSVPVYQRLNGDYYFFGAPGEYEIGIYQFGENKAYKTLVDKVFIGEPTPPKEPPANFESLFTLASTRAKALNDPATAKALSEAYKKAVEAMDGRPSAEFSDIATKARRDVLAARKGASRLVDWNSFLFIVDGEMKRLVKAPEEFKSALLVIAEALLIQ